MRATSSQERFGTGRACLAHWKRLSNSASIAVTMSLPVSLSVRRLSVLALTAVVTVAATTVAVGQAQPGGQAQGGRQRLTPPTPPAVQAGHPSGKLVIWG